MAGNVRRTTTALREMGLHITGVTLLMIRGTNVDQLLHVMQSSLRVRLAVYSIDLVGGEQNWSQSLNIFKIKKNSKTTTLYAYTLDDMAYKTFTVGLARRSTLGGKSHLHTSYINHNIKVRS